MKKLSRSNLTALAFAVGSLMVGANAVEAATITYDFKVSNTTGSLAGETLSGFFSFDDEVSIGSGGFLGDLELFQITDFEFSFGGSSFGLDDLDSLTSGAAFFEGTFVGLEAFDVNSLFSIYDDFGVSTFAYEDGFGEVNYTLRPSVPSVPEPTTALSLLVFGALGLGATLRRKTA